METNLNINKQLKKKVVWYHLPDIGKQELELELLQEEPLSINIQGKTYSVIMRTPGEERAHAAGFCLAEGIVDNMDDIADIALCDGDESNVAAVMLSKVRFSEVSHLLEKKGYVSQTSCGICGRGIIDDLSTILKPVAKSLTITFDQVMEIVNQMKDVQNLRRRCNSSHAAVILDCNQEILSSAEDAGRHNALDKAIGKLFLKGTLKNAAIALISSRASYEMIQKCGRAGIEIVISMSRPTALACDLGERLGMTLADVRDEGLSVFTGADRITSKDML
ncbi:MAG: formate dehydrogenase accessory sulfurtransferase FdhD [Desulfamplus sp.]|nr:formate dehydrogenase accessory sulfurtransferase FdhD [Desulfamplus sp.]MBF0258443.1 formate dehydrogenase accessory sulfurtransferase FdhD [Desulfamplus sp.]